MLNQFSRTQRLPKFRSSVLKSGSVGIHGERARLTAQQISDSADVRKQR